MTNEKLKLVQAEIDIVLKKYNVKIFPTSGIGIEDIAPEMPKKEEVVDEAKIVTETPAQ